MDKGEKSEIGQEPVGEQPSPEISDALRIMRGIEREKTDITQFSGTKEEKERIDAGFKEAVEIRRLMADLQSGDVEDSQVYLINRAIEVARKELGDDTLKDFDIIREEVDKRIKESGEYIVRLQNLRDQKEVEYQRAKDKKDWGKVKELEGLLRDITHSLTTGKSDLSGKYSKTRKLLSAIRGLNKILEGKKAE